MGVRVKRTRAGGRWTEARYFSFIRSALRRASMKYPVKNDVLDAGRKNKPKGAPGRHQYIYQCAECSKWYERKRIDVDHIVEAGSLKTFDDLPGFVSRLFCEADNLQLLCNGPQGCHNKKTHDKETT